MQAADRPEDWKVRLTAVTAMGNLGPEQHHYRLDWKAPRTRDVTVRSLVASRARVSSLKRCLHQELSTLETQEHPDWSRDGAKRTISGICLVTEHRTASQRACVCVCTCVHGCTRVYVFLLCVGVFVLRVHAGVCLCFSGQSAGQPARSHRAIIVRLKRDDHEEVRKAGGCPGLVGKLVESLAKQMQQYHPLLHVAWCRHHAFPHYAFAHDLIVSHSSCALGPDSRQPTRRCARFPGRSRCGCRSRPRAGRSGWPRPSAGKLVGYGSRASTPNLPTKIP